MTNGMDFFRLKFEYLGEGGNGKLVPKKEEALVAAVNYTDAECVAVEMMSGMRMFSETVKNEIVKTKISEILLTSVFGIDPKEIPGRVQYYLEEGEEENVSAMYAVQVIYKEDLGDKEKLTKEDIYVAAASPVDAIKKVEIYLKKNDPRDWTIKDVKYEKATSVIVTEEIHSSNLKKQQEAGI